VRAPTPRTAPARPARRGAPADGDAVAVRPVRRADLDQVIALDATVTGLEKQSYWRSVYRRYGAGTRPRRIAEKRER